MQSITLNLKENEEKVLPLVWTSGSGEITVNATLQGRGSKLSVLGAIFLEKDDILKVTINIDHVGQNTYSDTLVKAVLTDNAVGNFYGLLKIKKGAKNTNTFFREDSLLLSKTSKSEVIPSLEIDENEVKAGHASTVGPVDSEQMFYLTSKGITQEEAKRLIVQGYFTSIIDRLEEVDQKKLNNFLSKKFNI